MALYAALDVHGVDNEFALAVADDYSPTAAEQRDGLLTVFFGTTIDRDRAAVALAAAFPAARTTARDVDDENWARRSQQNLHPVTVGRLTVFPAPTPQSLLPTPYSLTIIPSMGFGTGHHASTRLCLAALQKVDLTGALVLDVGTGSGVLAIAARRLGARGAVGIDTDPDAIRSANENLQINPEVSGVRFECADLRHVLASPGSLSALFAETSFAPEPGGTPTVDLATANLTGTLLIRSAGLLIGAVRIGGHLVLSGVMQSEQTEVAAAFAGRTEPISVATEEEWVGLLLKRTL